VLAASAPRIGPRAGASLASSANRAYIAHTVLADDLAVRPRYRAAYRFSPRIRFTAACVRPRCAQGGAIPAFRRDAKMINGTVRDWFVQPDGGDRAAYTLEAR
jgi:hypothetical protein